MNRLTTYIILAFALISMSCCHKANTDTKPVLVVSVEPQKAILEEIAGDNWEVVCLMPNGAFPESYDPTSQLRVKAAKGKAWFGIGVIPFEHKMRSELEANMPTVNLADTVELLYGTHDHILPTGDSHNHGSADPHLWTSVRNNRKMAEQMLETLISLDSVNAPDYRRRFQGLCARIDSLDLSIAGRLHNSATFAVWHPSLSYFARDYGLNQINIGNEGKDLSAIQLREAIDHANMSGVTVFVIEQNRAGAQTQTVTDNINVPVVTIDLMGANWEEQLDRLTDELARP